MKRDVLNFKLNEVLSIYEHAKSILMTPTITIILSTKNPITGYSYGWVKLRLRDVTLTTRVYDRKWLEHKVKHLIKKNEICPYGDIRVLYRK